MGYPEPEFELQESSSSGFSVPDNASSTHCNKWDALLRKMLPAGAPLPDEDHLDYSITVDYQGPPPSMPSFTSGSIPKTPKFTSSFKTHHSLLVSRKNDILVERAHHDSVSFDEVEMAHHDPVSFDEEPENSASCSCVNSDFPVVTCDDKFEAHAADESKGNFSVNSSCDNVDDGVKSRSKVKACSRCGERGKFVIMGDRRERCIVCGAKYCKHCVLKAMGSMPEGRKCVGCIGKPIDEANREKLGKRSKLLLERVCSDLEVQQIMKVEKECKVNQIRPEQVVVNGRPLREEELVEILGCGNPPCNLKPGRYWYDEDSGLWGQEGEKPDRFISAKLNVGGKLLVSASNGNTKVYINGREITKLELRMLKLANVQSPHNTHFWVYEDGSYEEEGQNNIRGNIWAKVSTRLFCSLLSLPVPPRRANGPKDPASLSWRPMPEYLEQGKVQKLLLLGLEGSGSSTIFKQAKFIYGCKFTEQELQDIKLTIQSNIYRYLSVLLEGREHLEDEAVLVAQAQDLTAEKSAQGGILLDGTRQSIYSIKRRLKNFCDWLLDIVSTGDFDTFFPAAAREYAFILDEVWKDPALQETYQRMKDICCLPDVAKYFLDRAIEISSHDYQPSEEDIVYAEGVTTTNGLAFFEFSLDDHTPTSERYDDNLEVHPPLTNCQLIHIKSKGWFDGCKWLPMFEGIGAVVFCVSLLDYDQVQAPDNGSMSNKLLASRNLFESLVRHPSFADTPFVLLLNKYDAFEEKINSVPLTVCDWLSGFSPIKHHHNSHSLAPQAYHYIAVKFKVLYTSITGKKLFVWQTRASDRSSVKEAFRYIIEVIKWDQETRNMYLINLDDSFDSSERTCSPIMQQD